MNEATSRSNPLLKPFQALRQIRDAVGASRDFSRSTTANADDAALRAIPF
ncbi:hypothetical protein [Allorhizobium taibaishanense]|uniref:Uncharacterized protein n=1 Tax=Allorhizobium taibaishanense TaxID=887144 RepID=A0A7W6MTQ2_9HYPH|nr:hypothetical protein [Allorhizobium taibaishanense]MBB4007339.1 hypothetical protein [Allorhizobium taibaishanense]